MPRFRPSQVIATGDHSMVPEPPLHEATTAKFPLTRELPGLKAAVAEIAAQHRRGELDDAQFAGLYFLHWQIALHGSGFASRQRKYDPRPQVSAWRKAIEVVRGPALTDRLLEWLQRYQFRGVRPAIPAALQAWLHGRWPLHLRGDAASALGVLRAQARGRRMVTAITRFPGLLGPVLGKANAFVFFQHDLEHAYKFFHSPALYHGQRTLFRALEAALDRGLFAPYADDPLFAAKFHYLISDMNTHPHHASQYLRAILIDHYLRQSGNPPPAVLEPSTRQAVERIMRAVATPAALSAGA